MKFTPLPMAGAFLIEIEESRDERGFFARTYCRDEFRLAGLDPDVTQCSTSFNTRQHTLRGMHFQASPFEETKVVRCTMGAVFDVIADLRPESSTFRRWHATELTAENRRALYIPKGFAHGFLTLAENSEVYYQMSESFSPEHSRGIRWNDPVLAIEWPVAPSIISPKDSSYPDFLPAVPTPKG